MKTMPFRIVVSILWVITLLSVSCGGSPAISTNPATGIPGPPSPQELAAQGFVLPELPRITSEQLKQRIDSGELLLVVDTREEFLFNNGHLPQSINIIFEPNNESPKGFLALPKDRPIIFCCL